MPARIMWPLRSVVVGAAGLLRDANSSQGLQLLSGNTQFPDEDLRRMLADARSVQPDVAGGLREPRKHARDGHLADDVVLDHDEVAPRLYLRAGHQAGDTLPPRPPPAPPLHRRHDVRPVVRRDPLGHGAVERLAIGDAV